MDPRTAEPEVVPVHDVDEIVGPAKFHPSIEWLLRAAQSSAQPPHKDPACEAVREETRELCRILTRTLAEHQ